MLKIDDRELAGRLFLGSARYPSPQSLREAIARARPALVTVALRRQTPENGIASAYWEAIRESGVPVLPNTAGCRSAREAIQLAHLARELFATPWLKLEVTGEERLLQPDPFELVEAARVLCAEGFTIFPYMTEDLVVAEKLVSAGCRILMPWGSPIGSGRGIVNPIAIRALRAHFPEVCLVLDAGIGRPSHAAQAMELGCDAVLVNTAVALSDDPPAMAEAFAAATHAGRLAYEAGMMVERELASASTPDIGKPMWRNA